MALPGVISSGILAIGVTGTIVALAQICRRKLLREFPFFASYLAFETASSLAGLLLLEHYGKSSWPYFYYYWTAQAMGLALRFGVIYEIFSQVCRPYEGLRRAGTLALRWAGVLLLVAAVGVAVLGPAGEPAWALRGAVVIQRSIDVVQCGALVLLFLFASYFGLSWRNYVFGIAAGFAVIASLELLGSTLTAQYPSHATLVFNALPRLAYDLASAIWVAYLALPEPSRQELQVLPQHELEKWNRELLQLLER